MPIVSLTVPRTFRPMMVMASDATLPMPTTEAAFISMSSGRVISKVRVVVVEVEAETQSEVILKSRSEEMSAEELGEEKKKEKKRGILFSLSI